MADDCLVGFKFLERDDLRNDVAVKEAAENMFNEFVFDMKADHLGAKTEDVAGKTRALGLEGADALEEFDFTESFDFVF